MCIITLHHVQDYFNGFIVDDNFKHLLNFDGDISKCALIKTMIETDDRNFLMFNIKNKYKIIRDIVDMRLKDIKIKYCLLQETDVEKRKFYNTYYKHKFNINRTKKNR